MCAHMVKRTPKAIESLHGTPSIPVLRNNRSSTLANGSRAGHVTFGVFGIRLAHAEDEIVLP
jgi:hypothetical protein